MAKGKRGLTAGDWVELYRKGEIKAKESYARRIIGAVERYGPNISLKEARGHGSYEKQMVYFDPKTLTERLITPKNFKQASLLGKYHNAVKKFLLTGDASELAKFKGKKLLTKDGNKLPFVTNPEVIKKAARFGQIPAEDIYLTAESEYSVPFGGVVA